MTSWCASYFDDILIYSRAVEEYEEFVKALARFRKFGL